MQIRIICNNLYTMIKPLLLCTILLTTSLRGVQLNYETIDDSTYMQQPNKIEKEELKEESHAGESGVDDPVSKKQEDWYPIFITLQPTKDLQSQGDISDAEIIQVEAEE